MGNCNVTKCANPECQVKLKKCKMTNGLCPACYIKSIKKN